VISVTRHHFFDPTHVHLRLLDGLGLFFPLDQFGDRGSRLRQGFLQRGGVTRIRPPRSVRRHHRLGVHVHGMLPCGPAVSATSFFLVII
jgi:hypothetical protein